MRSTAHLTLELPPLPASVLLFLMHRVPANVTVFKLFRRGHVDELVRVVGDVSLVPKGENWWVRWCSQRGRVKVRSYCIKVSLVVADIISTVVVAMNWVVLL